MRIALFFKFIIAYALIAVASFVIISTAGSKLIESSIMSDSSLSLYNEAREIASQVAEYENAYSLDESYKRLSIVAAYQGTTIWLMDTEGIVYVDTSQPQDSPPYVIESFDRVSLGSSYYYTGNFFGVFEEDMLSVMTPVSGASILHGYLVIHKPLSDIYRYREDLLLAVHQIAIILFVLLFIILLLIYLWVVRPLNKITKGAREFAYGNLDYKIDIKSRDEMGYLSNTLNYMASEMNKANDYQHKFIANVSHDLRSPLTSIKGYAEAMQDGTIPPEMQGKYLGIVISEAERLNKLTQEMLTLDKMDSKTRLLNPAEFNINAMIKDTAASFEGVCRKKKVYIELLLEGEEMMVLADFAKIQQVVYNLLDNAIKFSRSEGTVTIETSERFGKAYISVKDTGIGIPMKDINRIWDRFYKSDSSRGKDKTGSGLGLAIVKEIITAHDQKINVISTEGVGTEFTFSLNLAGNSEVAEHS